MSSPEPKSSPTKKGFALGLAQSYETMRRQMAEATLPANPLAFSTDLRTFAYEVPIHQSFAVGSYVTIERSDGTQYLGQITAQEVVTRDGPEYAIKTNADSSLLLAKVTSESNFRDRVRLRFAQGRGELLGRVDGKNFVPTTTADFFDNATLKPAETEIVAGYLSTQGAGLDVGYAMAADKGKARVEIQPQGFRRHTFMCGQSRSGKTYALGIVLERVLMTKDSTRVIVLDPNSDFVRLNELQSDPTDGTPRQKEETTIEKEYRKTVPAIRILRLTAGLRIRLTDLSRDEQGAVLQLHPVRDLHAFNAFSKAIESLGDRLYSWQVLNEKLMSEFSAPTADLAMRMRNLRVADWEVWCKTEEPSIAQEFVNDKWRSMVIDIGTLPSADQRAVTALAVLNYVWSTKNPKKPVLLVLDEAHNICPSDPTSQMQQIATDYIVRIAGEGLKYGLRLLLVSQRPAKIHASVLTQCENLVLMRMTSQADLEWLTQIFSQAPPTLIARSRYFTQGDALIAGEIVKNPTFAKFEGRITREGGADVAKA